MRKHFKAKALIKIGLTVYILYQFYNTWIQLSLERSSDAAAGFLMGLLFMTMLVYVVKGSGFVYDEIKKWIAEHKEKHRINTVDFDPAA